MKIDLPHILIVDDDKRILELINDYLTKNNFNQTKITILKLHLMIRVCDCLLSLQ